MEPRAAGTDTPTGMPSAAGEIDARLQHLTAMVLHSTGADAAGITILHRDQIWLPSFIGPFDPVAGRAGSFCDRAVADGGELFEVADAAADSRFGAHPLVAGGPHFRHYAGVPLWADCRQLRATVWVMSLTSRLLTPEQRESLRMLAALAAETLELRYCDEVTGIVNRTFFVNSLQRMIEEGKTPLLVGYVNLRAFGRLVSAYGQAAGDHLLAVLAQRLLAWGGPDALVAHLGGDRFAFVLEGGAEAPARLDALHHVLGIPVILPGGRSHTARARVGIREAGGGAHALTLLHEAAEAAAMPGVAATRCYDTASRSEALLLVELNELLCGRAGHGHLEVHYEPQVDLRSGRLAGLEALVRWRHPRAGLLAPGSFIGLAERSGKITMLDMLVVRQACRDVAAWRSVGVAPVPVAINLGRESLLGGALPELLAEELCRHRLDGRQFECEITESQCVETHGLQDSLARLRALGLSIAIDDFGTGCSNLETVRRLSFDKLKIDRQFVNGVADDERLAALVRMVIQLATAFGAELLCEGVERERDLLWLRDHGVFRFQGWYFCKPLKAMLAIDAVRSLAWPRIALEYGGLRAGFRTLCGAAG